MIDNREKLINAMSDCFKIHFSSNLKFEEVITSIKQNDKACLSVQDSEYKKVCYLSKNKESLISTTLGKYIIKKFPNNFLDKEIDEFVKLTWQFYYAGEVDVTIINGKAIYNYYKSINSSCHSCMTGDNAKYVKLYTLNPEKVSLVTFNNLRALLWTCDDNKVFLDRIYPSGHADILNLVEWAKNRKYIHRENLDRLDDSDFVKTSDNSVIQVTLNHENVFPYFDTLCFGTIVDNKVILTNKRENVACIFRSVDGLYRNANVVNCTYCNLTITGIVHSFEDRKYCGNCYNSMFGKCKKCNTFIFLNNNYTIDNDIYCKNCYDLEFALCKKCKMYVSISSMDDGCCEDCR